MEPLFTERGVFIALEGGEGGGKSTQAERLARALRGRGHDVVLTREPGGTDVGTQLRRIVLDHATGEVSARTEALIYAADKAEHVDTVVLPALAGGTVVITDRYVDSALAYQGAGRSIDARELEEVLRWATSGLRPHLTVVIDVDPRTGLSRAGDPDRIEAEPLAFHQRVRERFLALAAEDPQHYLVVPGNERPDAQAERILAAVEPWLGQAAR
jgi:dTMP kinase